MKTSAFLKLVLNRFHNGKSYTTTPKRLTYKNAYSFDMVPAQKKGRNNLAGMIEQVAKKTGVKPTKAKLAICNSLGHSNFDGFAKSKGVKFAAVRAVLEAAIKREQAKGN